MDYYVECSVFQISLKLYFVIIQSVNDLQFHIVELEMFSSIDFEHRLLFL